MEIGLYRLFIPLKVFDFAQGFMEVHGLIILLKNAKHLLRNTGEGNGNPLQYSCLENPWTEESGRLQPIGLQRVQTEQLSTHTIVKRCLRSLMYRAREMQIKTTMSSSTYPLE